MTIVEEHVIREKAVEELLDRPYLRLLQFLYDRYWRGDGMHAFGANPSSLTSKECTIPVLVFLPGQNSRAGNWAPQIHRLRSVGCENAIFLLSNQESLLERLQSIMEMGGSSLILIGHSLGAIRAAECAFSPDNLFPIEMVISLAGRLKPATGEIPFPTYAKDVLPRVEALWQNFLTAPLRAKLITITAGDDWLVPRESSAVGDEAYTIEGRGHLGILFSKRVTQILLTKILR